VVKANNVLHHIHENMENYAPDPRLKIFVDTIVESYRGPSHCEDGHANERYRRLTRTLGVDLQQPTRRMNYIA
jgi:hypothetical protein